MKGGYLQRRRRRPPIIAVSDSNGIAVAPRHGGNPSDAPGTQDVDYLRYSRFEGTFGNPQDRP